MQPNLFLDPSDPPPSPTSSSPPQGAWDRLDETARIAALELLARLIARVITDTPIKELGHE